MNALFEEYVGRLVTRSRRDRVPRYEGGRLFCLTSVENDRCALFQTKPDILIW